MSPFLTDILIPMIVAIINIETTERTKIAPIPIFRKADVQEVSVETTSFWKITSETIGEDLKLSEIIDKSSILKVDISKDDGKISAVTKSKSKGSFLFCSL